MVGDQAINVVACCYNLSPADFSARLAAVAVKLGVQFSGVMVANRPGAELAGGHGWTIIQGSNAAHDFSGYREGLLQLQTNQAQSLDAVVFVNDSVFQHHHASANLRAVLLQLPLIRQIQVAAIAGKADRYAMMCHCNPWSGLSLYVATYCFALNTPALDTLLALQAQAEADGLNEDVPISSSNWAINMPANFREYLRAFISYGHPSFSWPGLTRYDIGQRLIAVKARCIYLEHRLSGEIGKHGCIVPINLRKQDRLRLYFAEKLASLLRKLRIV